MTQIFGYQQVKEEDLEGEKEIWRIPEIWELPLEDEEFYLYPKKFDFVKTPLISFEKKEGTEERGEDLFYPGRAFKTRFDLVDSINSY